MRNFNLDDFKKWIDEQEESNNYLKKNDYSEGDIVKTIIPFKKLVNRINEESGNRKSICKDFYTNGGTVVSFDRRNLIIEVNSGTFSINKLYVELSD